MKHSENDSVVTPRRGFLAAATGAVAAIAGCTSSASEGDVSTTPPTDTPTETPTPEPTTTPEGEITIGVDMPESIEVGEPLVLSVTGQNPGGEKAILDQGVSVVDVAASKRWARSYQIHFADGEETATTEWEIEWGTDHETTLLVNPDAASMSFLGGEGYETTDDLTLVKVEK